MKCPMVARSVLRSVVFLNAERKTALLAKEALHGIRKLLQWIVGKILSSPGVQEISKSYVKVRRRTADDQSLAIAEVLRATMSSALECRESSVMETSRSEVMSFIKRGFD